MKDTNQPSSHNPPPSDDRRKLIADFPSGMLLSVTVAELVDAEPELESSRPGSSKPR